MKTVNNRFFNTSIEYIHAYIAVLRAASPKKNVLIGIRAITRSTISLRRQIKER